MKKIIALLLVLVMALSLIACGETTPAATEPATTEPAVTEPAATEPAATEPAATEPAATEPAGATLSETVNQIMTEAPVEFMGGEIPVDLTDTSEDGQWALFSYTGLTDASKLSEIAVYEPMMMAQAFSLVLVRTAEGQDTKAVAQEIKDNADPRKWVCVGADEVAVVGHGDIVMLIMVDTGMGLSAQSYVDAFTKICGTPDFTI